MTKINVQHFGQLFNVLQNRNHQLSSRFQNSCSLKVMQEERKITKNVHNRRIPLAGEDDRERERENSSRVDVCATVAIKITGQRRDGGDFCVRYKSLRGSIGVSFFDPYFQGGEGSLDAVKKPKLHGRWERGRETEREKRRGALKRSRRFPDPVYRLPSFAETIVENLERQCESCLRPPTQRTNNRAHWFVSLVASPSTHSAPIPFVLRSSTLRPVVSLLSLSPVSSLCLPYFFRLCSGRVLGLKASEHRINSHVVHVDRQRSKERWNRK